MLERATERTGQMKEKKIAVNFIKKNSDNNGDEDNNSQQTHGALAMPMSNQISIQFIIVWITSVSDWNSCHLFPVRSVNGV